ncbi:hypothetical protein ACOME3_009358 [Neoechinorhynchus agilis]
MIRTVSYTIEFCVRMNELVGRSERVFISGNVPGLGSWTIDKAVEMDLYQLDGSETRWHKSVVLEDSREIKYRYFIGQWLTRGAAHTRGLIVRSWEAFRHPRVLELVHPKEQHAYEIDEFFHGSGKDDNNHGSSWLTGQSEVHLRFHSNPISIKKVCEGGGGNVACRVSVELVSNLCIDSFYPIWTSPSIVHMISIDSDVADRNGCTTFTLKPTSAIDIEFQSFIPEAISYRLEFSDAVCTNKVATPLYDGVFGTALIPAVISNPMDPDNKRCVCKAPIVDLNGDEVGQVDVDVLLGLSCDAAFISSAFQPRGAGEEVVEPYTLDIVVWEPVMHLFSLRAPPQPPPPPAPQKLNWVSVGVDMIEFDVQLTKDKVPIVYHDFDIPIISQDEEVVKVAIKDLTYNQLSSLKISANNRADCFPSLMQVLRELDACMALNVEVKYAMQYLNGGFEMTDYFERNQIIDSVLNCIMEYQAYESPQASEVYGSTLSVESCTDSTHYSKRSKPSMKRQIVLSSFDPDCCTMLQRKQNSYPVLFLSQGNDTSVWPQYHDFRTRDAISSVEFATSQHLDGIALPASDILNKPSKGLLKRIKDSELILFCWTINAASSSSAQTIDRLLKAGVHGIICDEVGSLMLEDINRFCDHAKTTPLFVAEQEEDEKLWKWLNRLRLKQRLKRLEETSVDLDEDNH